jgi:Zn-dependent metalloprotease
LVQQGSKIFPTKIYLPDASGTYATDSVRQTCYDNLQKVWKFYKTVFKRNSIDESGREIRATIHLSRGWANASWDEDVSAMFFGDAGRFDGRGWLYDPEDPELKDINLDDPACKAKSAAEKAKWNDKYRKARGLTTWECTLSLDVIGHEITHGVVQYTAALGMPQRPAKDKAAEAEAGTLNEHIADCFGIMIKHWDKSQTAVQGNWDMVETWWSKTAMDLIVRRGDKYAKQKWEEGYMRTFRVPVDKASQPD